MADYILSQAGSTFIEHINAEGQADTDDIADGAVTTDKIYRRAITEAKLGYGCVTTDVLADGAVTPAKLSFETYTKAESDEKYIVNEAESVRTEHIKDAAVTAGKIGLLAIKAINIDDRAVNGGKIALNTVAEENLSDECTTELKNLYANALKKTLKNNLGSNLTITDAVAGTKVISLKLTGYCRQLTVPSLTQSVEIGYNSKSSLRFNDTSYGSSNTTAEYGLGDIKDEYDFVSGTKIERLAFKKLKGTSADGTWAAHGSPLDGKYCYKLQNSDIAMLPTTYGNYVICTHFTNSGRSFYNASPDCGIGTVSCIATTTNAANKNALYFVVGSSIVGENGITYDTTTLEGFLSWIAGQYLGYPLEVCYVKAVPIVTQNTGTEIMLAQTNTINAGSVGTFEVTYVQDINKKIAELEAAIASSSAGI